MLIARSLRSDRPFADASIEWARVYEALGGEMMLVFSLKRLSRIRSIVGVVPVVWFLGATFCVLLGGNSYAVMPQQSDPYQTDLLPIQSRLLPPDTNRLKTPSLLSVSAPLGQSLQDADGEALPRPQQEAARQESQQESQDDGIVRMLKPLVVEPQSRETLTQRYPNGQVMIEREVALDQQGNFMNDGQWKMYDMEQQLMGSGRFANGQMVGLWRRVHFEDDHPWLNSSEFRGFENPLVSSAAFVDGKMHGSWLIKDRQDRKIVELHFQNGRRHGTGTWWHTNGQMRRQLHFQDDLLHGAWREWNTAGTLLTENWFVEGQRIHKEVNYFSENRPESEQSFLEAKLTLIGDDDWWNARLATYQPTGERIQTGPVKAWYDNGQKHLAGYYKDGHRDGDFAWWHPNGHRKLICTYDSGQRVGKWIWWHENGIKAAEGSYRDDLPIGPWLAWNEQGEITVSRDLGTDRESLARPDFDAEKSEDGMEELPPQLGLDAPLAPNLDPLDLTPPITDALKTDPSTDTTNPPQPNPSNPVDENIPAGENNSPTDNKSPAETNAPAKSESAEQGDAPPPRGATESPPVEETELELEIGS